MAYLTLQVVKDSFGLTYPGLGATKVLAFHLSVKLNCKSFEISSAFTHHLLLSTSVSNVAVTTQH